MKRHFQIMTLALVAILTACTSQEPAAPAVAADETQSDAPTHSSIRTVDEAAAVARHSLSMLPQSDSRSGITRSFDKNAVKVATRQSQSRSGETDTLMYVFNFDDNQGFAVVAADKSINGLIAITEDGYYNPSETPENPGLASYMATAMYILGNEGEGSVNGGSNPKDDGEWILKPAGDPFLPGTTPGGGGTPNYEYKTVHDTISSEIVYPNINLQWGQNYPEGRYISENGLCGCTNTAAMIAMAYLEKPNSLTMRAPGFVGRTIQLDWKKLKLHHKSLEWLGSYDVYIDDCYTNNTDNHEILGLLGKELFYRNGSVAYTNSTKTNIEKLEATLWDMGLYTHGPLDYDIDWVAKTLRKNGIIIAKGKNTDALSNSYHDWIIDGFYYHTITSTTYIKQNDGSWILYKNNGTYTNKYNHINWGWNGDGNGIYEAGIFNGSKYYKLDFNNTIPASGMSYENVELYPVFKTNVTL